MSADDVYDMTPEPEPRFPRGDHKHNIFWDTPFLRVYMDYSGDIVLQSRPKINIGMDDYIFVNPDDLLAFCKHYVSLFESED